MREATTICLFVFSIDFNLNFKNNPQLSIIQSIHQIIAVQEWGIAIEKSSTQNLLARYIVLKLSEVLEVDGWLWKLKIKLKILYFSFQQFSRIFHKYFSYLSRLPKYHPKAKQLLQKIICEKFAQYFFHYMKHDRNIKQTLFQKVQKG